MSAPWRPGSAVAFDRPSVEAQIEELIALLDYIDGDCDLEEDDVDCCPAFEDRLYTMGHMEMDGPGDPDDAEDEDREEDDPLEDDEWSASIPLAIGTKF